MQSYRAGEILLVFAFAACIAFQIFVPPAIGYSNNGDFGKMIGRFSLGAASHDASDEYHYFTPVWVYDKAFHWVSDNVSSELIPISIAILIGRLFSSATFDIRILGAIHALLWIGCFAAMLPLLRGLGERARYAAAVAALFIFTDTIYAAYLNTFFMDTAAFLFLAWAAVLWLYFVLSERPSPIVYALFCLASILSISSKSQHALPALFLFALAIVGAFRFRRSKRTALIAALTLPVTIGVTLALAPPTDTWEGPLWNVIALKVLGNSPAPVDDLRELGLGPEFARFAGQFPDTTEHNPLADPVLHAQFLQQMSPAKLVRFYLRHPLRALAIVYGDLKATESLEWRTGKYERWTGPPQTQAKSFAWWSGLRSALFRVAPWHIPVWYAAFLAVAITLAIRQRSGAAFLGIALACVGLTELAISTLADSGETERHLFLFHTSTDFTILLALVWTLRGKRSTVVPAS